MRRLGFMIKKVVKGSSIVGLFFCLTFIFLYPLVYGLILLPLDLLISNYEPWSLPNNILLKNPYMQDSIVQLYPWKHFVFDSFVKNLIPLWNPYQLMGMPFMASMKPMVFYPLNIFYIFGEINAWHMLLFSQIFLSMLFSYLLARELSINKLGSILVSISFSLSSLMIGVLEFGSEGHVLLWFPLFFYCTKKYLDSMKARYIVILSLSISACIFAGQLQYFGYGLITLLGFIVYYGKSQKTNFSTYAFLFIGIALGIGISAIQLLPSIELFKSSYRGLGDSYEIFSQSLMKPYQLFRLLAPDFFGNPVTRDTTIGYIEQSGYFGIVPLFFCFYAAFFGKKNIFTKFFMGSFIVALLFSLNGIGQVLYFLKIPLITSGYGERVFSIVLFSGSLLAGFGVNEFIASNAIKKKIISLLLFCTTFIIIAGGSILLQKTIGLQNNLLRDLRYPFLILFLFALATLIFVYKLKEQKYGAKALVIFVIILTFFDLFRMGYRFLTFSNSKFLYPQTPVVTFVKENSATTLSRNYGLTEPELATYLNIYTSETYNPLYLMRSGIVLNALQKIPPNQLPVNKYHLSRAKGDNLKSTLDFLGTSFIVARKDFNPSIEYFGSAKYQNVLSPVFSDDTHTVYKNSAAYPRFNVLYKTVIARSDTEALKLITEDKLDFKKQVIVEEEILPNSSSGTGSAILVSSDINNQKFNIESSAKGIFYISDTFFPGWTANINNKPAKIYRVNYNFKGIVVPEGKSTIELTYFPISLLVGIYISIGSIILLIILSISSMLFYKRHPIVSK